jgi:transcriptional regulator of acetoin/glycerol metabolism
VIQPDDLPPEIFQPGDFESSIPGDPLADEKTRFLQALQRSRGNRALAARLLGISRATLYRRLGVCAAEKLFSASNINFLAPK